MQRALFCKTKPSEKQDDADLFEIGPLHASHKRLPHDIPSLRDSISWDQVWRLWWDFFHLAIVLRFLWYPSFFLKPGVKWHVAFRCLSHGI